MITTYTLEIGVEGSFHHFRDGHPWLNKEQAYEEAKKLREKLPENLDVWVYEETSNAFSERVGAVAVEVNR